MKYIKLYEGHIMNDLSLSIDRFLSCADNKDINGCIDMLYNAKRLVSNMLDTNFKDIIPLFTKVTDKLKELPDNIAQEIKNGVRTKLDSSSSVLNIPLKRKYTKRSSRFFK